MRYCPKSFGNRDVRHRNVLCIYYIQKIGQPQCRSDKLFVNIREADTAHRRKTALPTGAGGREKPEIQIPDTALQPCRERLREYEDQKVIARRALRALQVLS